MIWWHLLFCIISIQKIHFVHSQYDDDEVDEESTTIPPLTTTANIGQQRTERNSLLVSNLTVNSRANNESEHTLNPMTLNEPSKQRIIVALAVLCAALAVLLGFLISIVVCQWLPRSKGRNDFDIGRGKPRPDYSDSSHNYREHSSRQTVKL